MTISASHKTSRSFNGWFMFLCFSLLTVSPGMAVAAVASAAANGDSGEISGLAPPLIPRGYPAVEKHTSDKVHGTIMALTVAVIFPFGALSWHLFAGVLSTRTLLYIHGLCQALGLGMLISGFGVAVWVAITHAEVYNDPYGHAVLGTITVILFLIQFVLGIIHHFVIFRRSSSDKETTSTTPPRQSNPYFRLAHIWLGRAAWIIAACEGGTGLVLAANSPNGEKVYGSIVGIVGVLWIGIVVTSMVWKRNATGTGKQAEKQTDESVAAAGMGSGDVEEIAVRMEKDTGA